MYEHHHFVVCAEHVLVEVGEMMASLVVVYAD